MLFEVRLVDQGAIGISRSGVVNLGLGSLHAPTVLQNCDMAADDFVRAFLLGKSLDTKTGLAFGRFLFSRLTADAELLSGWADAQSRRGQRPLRVELILPPPAERPHEELGRRSIAIHDLPFELLADSNGFLFRRPGWTLVRTFRGLRPASFTLERSMALRVVSANPAALAGEPGPAVRVSEDVFRDHEVAAEKAGVLLGLRILTPCRNATRASLREALRTEVPTAIVTLVAHGDALGGSIALHAKEASGAVELMSARDLAAAFRTANVRVAFLWSCHSARWDPVYSSVAAALLDPEQGNLVAIVAAHAALRAAGTVPFALRLLESLPGAAQRNLERAMTEARVDAFPEDDLQWAVPVYYARPSEGKTVTLDETVQTLVPGHDGVRHDPRTRVLGSPEEPAFFRGRESEITSVLGSLGERRFISIVGMPGIGKTGIAVVASKRALHGSELQVEKAFWFSLDMMGHAEDLREEIALAYGQQPRDYRTDRAIAAVIGEVAVLMVLDNAEDLLRSDREAFRRLLNTLLVRCPRLYILTTTRRLIGDLDGMQEAEFTITQLVPPSDRDAFIAAAGDRLTDDERLSSDLPDLVSALEGHPQSLILVAGQVGRGRSLRSLRELLVEDQDVNAILAHDLLDEDSTSLGPDTSLRGRRLVSSLNLSFLPLKSASPRAAEVFVWLGHLPGGLPEALVPHVFGEQAMEAVGALLRQYLVERVGPSHRLRLLAPMRWYALQQTPDVFSDLRQQELLVNTFRAFGALLQALRLRLDRPGAQAACREAMLDESNIVHLVGLAKARGASVELDALAPDIATSVCLFAILAMHGDRARLSLGVCEDAVLILRQTRDSKSLGRACRTLGEIYARTERLADAERVLREGLVGARISNDRACEAESHRSLGEVLVRTNRLREGEAEYNAALTIYESIDYHVGIGDAHKMLGALYVRTNRFDSAAKSFDLAIASFRFIGYRVGEADALWSGGEMFSRYGRLEESRIFYNRALSIYRDIESRLGEANALKALGDISKKVGQVGEAERCYRAALSLLEQRDNTLSLSHVLCAMADIYAHTNRHQEAREAVDRSLLIFRAIPDQLGEANALCTRGDCRVQTGEFAHAKQDYEEADAIFDEIDDPFGRANVRRGMGNMYRAVGNCGSAFHEYQSALRFDLGIGQTFDVAADYLILAETAAMALRQNQAVSLAHEALQRYTKIDSDLGIMNACYAIGVSLRFIGDHRGAIAALLVARHVAMRLNGHALAGEIMRHLVALNERVEVGVPSPPEVIDIARRAMMASIVACRNALRVEGRQLLTPLDES